MQPLQLLGTLVLFLGVTVALPAKEKLVHRQADLSDHVHDDSGHGYQYDHEAFLGKEEAKTFDQLSPEESKERLGKLVDHIDTNKDGHISHGELHQWIKHRQLSYIEEKVDKHWMEYDQNKDGQISWEEYKKTTYGYFMDEEFDDVDDKSSYKAMLTRDERRFRGADLNGDGIATKEEFTAFLHPEEYDHMRAIMVRETIEDFDRNGDGKINLQEYIGDMFVIGNGESEPEWVQTEKKHFTEFRDVDKDGYLDDNEVTQWIFPGQIDHVNNEAKHLIHETDMDKDGKITKKEILGNWNMFVGSQDGRLFLNEIINKVDVLVSTITSTITDYGKLIMGDHDEL